MNGQQIQRSIDLCRSSIEREFDQLNMPHVLRPMLLRSVHDHFHARGNWGLERLDENIRRVELRPELWTSWFEPACQRFGEETVQRAIDSVRGWHEAMRAWRVGREVAKPKTFKDRMHRACNECKDEMHDAFNYAEGRHYSITWQVEFGVAPRIERRGHRLDIYVTPAWKKKVGKNRAVMFPDTKHRTFIYDSEPIADSEMSDRGVRCMMLKGVGVMKKHYFKTEISRLKHRYDQLISAPFDLPYVDAYREFVIGNLNREMIDSEVWKILDDSHTFTENFKEDNPCEYSLYYLEHETLDLQSMGHTFLHAKNLLNRRLKKATLDALI
jgi:hypothetical protein